MTITNIKQLIDIVLDSSRNHYFPELVINGEIYDIRIKGLVTKNGYIINGSERKVKRV